MTVAVTVDQSASGARPLVLVTSTPATTEPVAVWRVHADNTRHRVITVDPDARLIGGNWSGFDDHYPVNQFVTYEATTATQSSAPSELVFVPSRATRLVHRSDQSLTVTVDHFVPPAERNWPLDSVARSPIVGSGIAAHQVNAPLGGEVGVFRCRCDSDAAFEALFAVVADGGPLLITRPYNDLGVRGWLWVQPGGLQWSNPTPSRGFPYRFAQFGYEATLEPDVDAATEWTLADVAALCPTVAAVKATYATVRAMKLDVRS